MVTQPVVEIYLLFVFLFIESHFGILKYIRRLILDWKVCWSVVNMIYWKDTQEKIKVNKKMTQRKQSLIETNI